MGSTILYSMEVSGMERWKTFIYPYQASNLGRVRNVTTGKIKQEYIEDNHCYVDLYFDGHRKSYAVHRIVAYCFMQFVPEKGLYFEDYDVHHKDEVAWHNTIFNVVYMTKENHIEFHRSKESKNTKEWKRVHCIELGRVFASAGEASRFLLKGGVTTSKQKTITKCIKVVCSGKGNTAYGYHWEYYNERR